MSTIATCLLFQNQAEEAVRYYLSIFEGGKITRTISGPNGSVMGLDFELFGRPFMALNGPATSFTQNVSLFVTCDTQAEVDRYWSKLTADGGKEIQCGWCTDKLGVTWQIVPKGFVEIIGDKDRARAGRALQAMMKMKKLDIVALEAAADGP